MMDDTISAIATALGVGSIGVIRLSGPDSLAIADRIFAGRESLEGKMPGSSCTGISWIGKGSPSMKCWLFICRVPIPIQGKMSVRSNAMEAGRHYRKSCP